MKKNHSKSENKYLCRAYQTKDPIQIYKEMSKTNIRNISKQIKNDPEILKRHITKESMYGKQEGMYGKQAYKHDPYLH